MENNSIETASVKQSKLPLYISALIVVSLVLAYFFVPGVQDFLTEAWNVLTSDDNERIEAWVGNFGWFGPVVLVLAMILQMFLLVIPTIALMVVSVLAYGPIFGSIIILVAVFSASSVGYFIGRYFGPLIVEKLIGHKNEKKIGDFIDDYGFWAVIVTRLNPFLSNDAISFVAGILKMVSEPLFQPKPVRKGQIRIDRVNLYLFHNPEFIYFRRITKFFKTVSKAKT